jgi:hypothetical protein
MDETGIVSRRNPIDIEGMSDEQLAKLEAARKPLPIKQPK